MSFKILELGNRLKRDLEHEQRVTLEIEGWLSDRRIKLKELHKFWSEKLRMDVAQKDQELAVRVTQEQGMMDEIS